MKKHIAHFKVSLRLLAELLHLPPGTSIHGAKHEGDDPVITIFVEHPDLREVEVVGDSPETIQYPEASPSFRTNEPVEPITFVGWGQHTERQTENGTQI